MTVKIKPLVWVADKDDPDCIRSGEYWIYHEGLGYQAYLGAVVFGDPHKTLAAAQDAVWQHHVASILAAIEAPAQEPVAWQYRFKIEGDWSSWLMSERYRSPCKDEEQRPLYTTPPDHLALVAAAYRDAAERCNVAQASRRKQADDERSKPEGRVNIEQLRRWEGGSVQAGFLAKNILADAEAHLTALLRAEYERGVRDTLAAADKEAKGKVHIGGQAFRTVKLDDLGPAALALLTQEGR